MENNEVEKRTCIRFAIPGTTVSYEFKDYTEEFFPLVDISLGGGVKFLGEYPLEINADITLKISVPGERIH